MLLGGGMSVFLHTIRFKLFSLSSYESYVRLKDMREFRKFLLFGRLSRVEGSKIPFEVRFSSIYVEIC